MNPKPAFPHGDLAGMSYPEWVAGMSAAEMAGRTNLRPDEIATRALAIANALTDKLNKRVVE